MIKALISGQAAAAVIMGQNLQVRPIHGTPYEISRASSILGQFNDVEEIEANTLDEIDDYTQKAWALDRALYRLYIIADEETIDRNIETRAAQELIDLVRKYGIKNTLISWLQGVDIPESSINKLRNIAKSYVDISTFVAALEQGSHYLSDENYNRIVRGNNYQALEFPHRTMEIAEKEISIALRELERLNISISQENSDNEAYIESHIGYLIKEIIENDKKINHFELFDVELFGISKVEIYKTISKTVANKLYLEIYRNLINNFETLHFDDSKKRRSMIVFIGLDGEDSK